MVDPLTSRRWLYRTLFVALGVLGIYVNLLPIDLAPGGLPGPDFPVLLAYAWVLRRPAYVPVLLVAGVLLATDILFLRPIGLWSALARIGFEILRAREPISRDQPLLLEWATVGVVLALVTVAHWLVLSVFMVNHPGAGLLALQFLVTLASYPLVVAFTRWGLRLRRSLPGVIGGLGHRL